MSNGNCRSGEDRRAAVAASNDVRDFEVRSIDDIAVTLGNSARIPGRRHGAGIDRAGEQRGEHLRRAAGLDHHIVPPGLHVAPLERLHCKVGGRGADACNPDLLTAQILQPFDFWLGENALREIILDTCDVCQFAIAAHGRAHQADAAVNQQLRVAAEHRRCRQR